MNAPVKLRRTLGHFLAIVKAPVPTLPSRYDQFSTNRLGKLRLGCLYGRMQHRGARRAWASPVVALCALVLLDACAGKEVGSTPRSDSVDETVGEVIRSLPDLDDEQREMAVSALTLLGPQAMPAISQGLESPDPEIRLGIVDALSRMEGANAVPVLLIALQDDSSEVRLMTVEALGKFRDPRAVQPLMNRFRIDDDDQVRYECLTSLGLIGDPAAIDLLSTAISDTNPYVRMWAMDALCQMKAPPAEPLAIALLTDPNPYVAQQTLQSCGSLLRSDTGNAKLIDVAIHAEQFETTVWARRYLREHTLIAATGSKVREQIRQAARTELDGPNATNAAMLLGDLGDPASDPFLIAALRDPNPYVRHHAAYLLGNSSDSTVVPALIVTLKDEQQFVAATAFDSLKKFAQRGDQRAQDATASFKGTTFDQALPR